MLGHMWLNKVASVLGPLRALPPVVPMKRPVVEYTMAANDFACNVLVWRVKKNACC